LEKEKKLKKGTRIKHEKSFTEERREKNQFSRILDH